jgi:N-acetylglucosamine malate deacetylase 1
MKQQARAMARRLKRRLRREIARVGSLKETKDGWRAAGGPVLAIAPHPDDEIIGGGGTLCRHVRAGDPVTVVYVTRGEKSRGYPWLGEARRAEVREREARAGCRVLRIRDLVFLGGKEGQIDSTPSLSSELRDVIMDRRPRIIYLPHPSESHPDHTATHGLVMTALREAGSRNGLQLLGYEVGVPARADIAVDVTGTMSVKLRALRRHRLALDAGDWVRTAKVIAAYRSRTTLLTEGYAEVFARVDVPHESRLPSHSKGRS